VNACVLTFEPQSREFFAAGQAPARLTRLRDKLELMEAAGIERVHVARFSTRASRRCRRAIHRRRPGARLAALAGSSAATFASARGAR